MKTKQEQIEKMAGIIAETLQDKRVENGATFVSYLPSLLGSADKEKEVAEALAQAGYGDVSEYKAEIERLNSHNGFLQSVISHSKDMLDEAVKQTQTDTINTIVKYCENQKHWNELKDCKLWGGKSDDLRVFLNGIFKEVEK